MTVSELFAVARMAVEDVPFKRAVRARCGLSLEAAREQLLSDESGSCSGTGEVAGQARPIRRAPERR
jgi:hypothetical protein